MDDDAKPTDAPTGLPSEEEPEVQPLGAPDADDAAETGEEAMPGIVTDGEPPDAG
jgi:hypothetical protein